MVELETI